MKKLTQLSFSVILFFIIGFFYGYKYYSLTRQLVSNFANYNLEFYGAKQIRIYSLDIGLLFTLIPIGLFFIVKNTKETKYKLLLIASFTFLLILYYCVFCQLESRFIKYTTTVDMGNIYRYHHLNINYRLILFISILTVIITQFGIVRIYKKAFL